MEKSKRLHYFEIGLYIFICFVAMAFPLFMRFENGREWNFIYKEWIRLVPFFLIFLVNNFILVPKLLFKSKYIAYIVSCLGLLVLITSLNSLFFQPKILHHSINSQKKELILSHPINRAPSTHFIDKQSPEFNDTGMQRMERPPHLNKSLPGKMFFSFGVFMIGLLIIGFNSGIKFFIRWMDEESKRDEKEKQYLNAELAFLKHQVSPHFFMNTLNNIHALVDIDSERSKDAIIKLSRLMRYLLYEADEEKVPLSKEIEFLESYVELMRLRYDEANLSINIHYLEANQPIHVPSLLFLPLLENAFKHGVQINEKSFIDILFRINEKTLILITRNKNFSKEHPEFDEASGIGLDNIRKRLNLIYKENYDMQIHRDNGVFEVKLSIPIE